MHMGWMVLSDLELDGVPLCCRANIRILVKDTVAAKNGYGPYVEPVSVDINSQGACMWQRRGSRGNGVVALATATASVLF